MIRPSWRRKRGSNSSSDLAGLEFFARCPLDDPKFYTKPWVFLKGNYYRMKAQDFEEIFCVPSEAIEYRDTLATPAGNGDLSAK